MIIWDPSIPLPTKPTGSRTTASSTKSTLPKKKSTSLDFLLSNEEMSLIQSIRDATTSYGSSIHLSLRVDRKDVDVHCSIFINHKYSGKLVIQLDEYPYFEAFMKAIGVEITTEVFNIKNTYYQFERGVAYARKLHKP